MRRYIRNTAVSLFAGAVVVVGTATPASADHTVQDGLINVSVGDITVEDVNVGVAAVVVAQVCGLKVGPVVVLGTSVDTTGEPVTVCTIRQRDVVFSQN